MKEGPTIKREIDKHKHLFPAINEKAFRELSDQPQLWRDSPFSKTNLSRPVTYNMIREEVEETLKREHDAFKGAAESFVVNGEPTVMEIIKRIKSEHDAVHGVIKELVAKGKYQHGTILDSFGVNTQIITMPEERGGTAKLSKTTVTPKIKGRHFFVVLHGEVIPLITFPEI